MINTKRQPVSAGEMLIEEFMEPLAVTQGQLATAMGVSRRMINEICNNKHYFLNDLIDGLCCVLQF